ncbi:MAG: GldG family protein [bacterium]|nr:GldG family protein [bacterium]
MKKLPEIAGLLGGVLIAAALVHFQAGKVWNALSWVLSGSGLTLAVFWGVARFGAIRRLISLRSFRYGGNAAAAALMVLVLLGLLNFTINRHSLRVDLSKGGQFSLSPQTRNILKNLKRDVRIIAFVKAQDQKPVEDILKSYRFYASRLKTEFVDPDKKPGTAKLYGVTTYGTLVLESGGQSQKITENGEQAITNALIRVTREERKTVLFLDGHGENDIDSSDKTGYASARKAIEDENYRVRKLNLAAEKRIPSDCTVLVACGPRKAFFQSELDTIQAFLERGGKALFMIDAEVPGFEAFLKTWGMTLGGDVVIDASGMGQLFGMGPEVPLVTDYPPHPVTDRFRVMTFFPYCRSVTPETRPGTEWTVAPLLRTSANSWGETTLGKAEVRFDKGRDLAGPVTIAAVSTKKSGGVQSRLAVFGDADFANNSYFRVQGNGDLFMNTVSWLAEEEDLISIRAKQPEDRRVFLNAKQGRLVFWLTVVAMPLAAALAGVWMYIRRERRSR